LIGGSRGQKCLHLRLSAELVLLVSYDGRFMVLAYFHGKAATVTCLVGDMEIGIYFATATKYVLVID
jgi:hypothetical protein